MKTPGMKCVYLSLYTEDTKPNLSFIFFKCCIINVDCSTVILITDDMCARKDRLGSFSPFFIKPG